MLEQKVKEIGARRNIDGPQISQVEEFDEAEFVRPTFIETNDFTQPF